VLINVVSLLHALFSANSMRCRLLELFILLLVSRLHEQGKKLETRTIRRAKCVYIYSFCSISRSKVDIGRVTSRGWLEAVQQSRINQEGIVVKFTSRDWAVVNWLPINKIHKAHMFLWTLSVRLVSLSELTTLSATNDATSVTCWWSF